MILVLFWFGGQDLTLQLSLDWNSLYSWGWLHTQGSSAASAPRVPGFQACATLLGLRLVAEVNTFSQGVLSAWGPCLGKPCALSLLGAEVVSQTVLIYDDPDSTEKYQEGASLEWLLIPVCVIFFPVSLAGIVGLAKEDSRGARPGSSHPQVHLAMVWLGAAGPSLDHLLGQMFYFNCTVAFPCFSHSLERNGLHTPHLHS